MKDYKDNILKVVVEHGATTIGYGAFSGCDELITVSLANTLTSIGDYAFNAAVSLKAIDIPNGVTYLGKYALCCCPRLVSVTLPEGLITLSESVFDQTWPETIIVPSTVTSVESRAFAFTSPAEIIFIGDAPSFSEDAFFNANHPITVWYPANNSTWTEEIMQDYGADITWLPRGEDKEDAELGDPVYTTASGTWGDNITWSLNESGLLTISGKGTIPKFYDFDSVYDENGKRILYPWHHYADSITDLVVEDGITALAINVFNGLQYLKSATLSNSVTDIATQAFMNCSSLASVSMGNKITNIGDASFASCTSLTEITIPESVTSIGNYAFEGCTNLNNVVFPNSITTIKKYAFWECSSLKNITLSANLTEIMYGAFEGCTALTSVTIPASVKKLDKHIFYDCNNLKELYFKGNPPQFHNFALLNLTTTAYYPSDNAAWTANMMQNYGGNITWKPYCPNGHTYVNDYCSGCGVAAPASSGGSSGSSSSSSGSSGGSDSSGTGTTGTNRPNTTRPVSKGTELSADRLEEYAENGNSMTIATEGVRITFDATALEAIAEQAERDEIYLDYEEIKEAKLNNSQKNAIKSHLDNHKGHKHVLTFTVTLISNGKEIHDFNGGNATLKIPFTPHHGTKGEDYKVFFVDANGNLVPMETTYENGYLIVKLSHFSEYVVMHMAETTEETAAAETTVPETTVVAVMEETEVTEPVASIEELNESMDTIGIFLRCVIAVCSIGIVAILIFLFRQRKKK